MFCPKCGTQNPDNGKFCRSCGTNLQTVSNVLSGRPGNDQMQSSDMINQMRAFNRKGKPIHWEGAVSKLFSGLAFLVVAIALAVTGAAGGRAWWYWLLFPAFGALGSGIAQIIQLKKMERHGFISQPNNSQDAFSQNYSNEGMLSPGDFDHIERLALLGNKIEAVKVYRDITGAGLKESKRAVERIERGNMPRPVPNNLMANKPLEDYNSTPPPRGSIYETGDLNIPPSVTEGTTRHLEINKEGETMTLPQKK